jgi:hypothetical protein
MYGIILNNICCSFVCVSAVTIDVCPGCAYCTGGNCEEHEASHKSIVKDKEVILRTCNIQWNLSKPNPE